MIRDLGHPVHEGQFTLKWVLFFVPPIRKTNYIDIIRKSAVYIAFIALFLIALDFLRSIIIVSVTNLTSLIGIKSNRPIMTFIGWDKNETSFRVV